jgi:hypothetical protein
MTKVIERPPPVELGPRRHGGVSRSVKRLRGSDEQLRHEPELPTRRRKRMRSNPVAPWELRIGDYRVFDDIEPADVETSSLELAVLAIGLKIGNRVWIGGEEHEL